MTLPTPEQENDLLWRLRNPLWSHSMTGPAHLDKDATTADLAEAAAEIDRLRLAQGTGSPASSVANVTRRALEFYADPFAWKAKHDPENDVSIPDFYSETSFGDFANTALDAMSRSAQQMSYPLSGIAIEARFLLDRLGELDDANDDGYVRDFEGHVRPSMSRLEELLSAPAQQTWQSGHSDYTPVTVRGSAAAQCAPQPSAVSCAARDALGVVDAKIEALKKIAGWQTGIRRSQELDIVIGYLVGVRNEIAAHPASAEIIDRMPSREAVARELCRQDIPWNWQGKNRDAWVEIEWKGYLKKADAIRALAVVPPAPGPVQDTWLVGPPDLKAMSGSVDSDRVIQLHFRRPATDADRKWLLEAINAKIAADGATLEMPDLAAENAKLECLDWLETEVMAIDPVYRGSPTYDHDAYWMKSEVYDLINKARAAFAVVPDSRGTTPTRSQEG